MNYLTLLITVPVTVFSILFVVANAGSVSLSVYPGAPEYTMPIYTLGIALLAGGFFLGALFVGLHAQKTTVLYWREKQRSARLEKELDDIQARKDEDDKSLDAASQQKRLS